MNQKKESRRKEITPKPKAISVFMKMSSIPWEWSMARGMEDNFKFSLINFQLLLYYEYFLWKFIIKTVSQNYFEYHLRWFALIILFLCTSDWYLSNSIPGRPMQRLSFNWS